MLIATFRMPTIASANSTKTAGGVEKDLEKAKENYRLAYRENHPLAKRKLFQFDFLH